MELLQQQNATATIYCATVLRPRAQGQGHQWGDQGRVPSTTASSSRRVFFTDGPVRVLHKRLQVGVWDLLHWDEFAEDVKRNGAVGRAGRPPQKNLQQRRWYNFDGETATRESSEIGDTTYARWQRYYKR